MASNKDILEAQRYNRRRLVTAFVSGTPSGRELEPSSPIGPLVAGGALSIVLILIALAMGRFVSPTLPTGWENNTLIVVKGGGGRYLAINGVLRPVTNLASARLLAEPGQFKVSEVDGSALDGIPRGSLVGIPDAPDGLPAVAQLHSQDWTACGLADGTSHTWIGAAPTGIQAAATALVRAEGETYLIDGAGLRHRIPTPDERVLLALFFGVPEVHPVTPAWLSLFERGSDLTPLRVVGAGAPAVGLPAGLATAVIGSVIAVEDGATQRHFVVTGPGQLTPLSDVAFKLYGIGTGAEGGNPLTTTVAEISGLTIKANAGVPEDWPAVLTLPEDPTALPCATLQATKNGPATRLAALPATSDAATPSPTPTASASAPPEATAADLVTVRGGSGALVRTSAGGTLGAVALITDTEVAYGLAGDPDDTLARLGYAAKDVSIIPAAWLALVPSGGFLSAEAAWATVRAA